MKIKNLTQVGVSELRRSNTLPALPLQRTRPHYIRERDPALIPPKVNYAQILLEEERGSDKAQDDITITPVLIWRPGQRRKYAPSLKATQEHDRGSCIVHTTSHGHDGPASAVAADPVAKDDSHAIPDNSQAADNTGEVTAGGTTAACEGKGSVKVFKTNLTDTLPPHSKIHKSKVNLALVIFLYSLILRITLS